MKLKNKVVAVAVTVGILGNQNFFSQPVSAEGYTFNDVSPSESYYEAINQLVEKGVVKGFSDGTFRPLKSVTRAEFATFLARALELPKAESSFKDVKKDSPLYDGVSRSYKAGIIKGFSDGNFKGTKGVSREDMAVMIDRALKIKGDYNKTQTLNYTDSKNIGAYAIKSVQKMSAYKIMSQYKNSRFEGKLVGTRSETVDSIYKMLNVIEGDFYGEDKDVDLTVEEIKSKNPLKMTLNEIKKAYGDFEIVERWDQFGKVEGFKTRDVWKQYYEQLHAVNWEKINKSPIKPDAWLEEAKATWMKSLIGEYVTNYPNYEIVSINGVPFWQSFLMTPQVESYLAGEIDVFPKPPSEINKFKIDIHIAKSDFATYFKNKTEIGELTKTSYTKDNKALMVDLVNVFEDVPQVKVGSDSISYGDNFIKYKIGSNIIRLNGVEKELPVAIEKKNEQVMIPIRDFSELLGLYTRVTTTKVKRIEITNYQETKNEYYR